MRFKPELKAAWGHESLADRGQLTAGLMGQAGLGTYQPFTVQSSHESRDGALVSAGAAAAIANRGSAFVAYQGNLTNRGSEHSISAGARVSW